jgi:PAS domain S-box-containing protein
VEESLRTGLAIILLASVGRHYRVRHAAEVGGDKDTQRSNWPWLQVAAFSGAIALGWVATEKAGERRDSAMRNDVMTRAQLGGASVDVEKVKTFHWDERDLNNPNYLQLKELMKSMVRANRDLRFAMLLGLKGQRVQFLVDSEPPSSVDYSPPGQEYTEAAPDYLKGMLDHHPFIVGPTVDRWGTWIIASVPLVDLGPNGYVAFELDITAADWTSRVRLARLPAVLITILISVLLLTYSFAQEALREKVAQLTASEQRNSSLVDSSPNCIHLLDPKGRIQAINPAGLKAVGLPKLHVIGRRFFELWPPKSKAALENALRQTMAGEPVAFEADVIKPGGAQFTWSVATNPVRDLQGRVTGFVCVCADITDRKQSEQALLSAKLAAESAMRAKGEFLAVMSHEIRTPLGGVIGLLGILQEISATSEQRTHLRLARDNAERLLHILDDILDMSKIESGKLTIEITPFDIRKEFDQILDAMRVRAEAKGCELTWSIDEQVPPVLLGDPTRLSQILSNLVSNAIKFTDQGSVTVQVRSPRNGESEHTLHVSVRDTGVGIPLEVQARLFTRFEQADVSTTRKYGGTGLGLSIVKDLVEMMKGQITIESQPNAGATFHVSVPLRAGKASDLAAKMRAEAPVVLNHPFRLRILCAEDERTNRVITEYLVKQMGHDIECATNGREALERLRMESFDAVLMDNRMPEVDGFQATRTIRDPRSDVLDHDIYIIANTANASENYRTACLEAGMNDYMIKPTHKRVLHAALERAIAYQQQRGRKLPMVATTETLAEDRELPLPPALSEAELLASIESSETTGARSDPTEGLSMEAMAEIVAQFQLDMPNRLEQMRTALREKDAATFARCAHSIKSCALYVQGERLSELCARLESLADAGRLGGCPEIFSQVEDEFRTTSTRLQTSRFS